MLNILVGDRVLAAASGGRPGIISQGVKDFVNEAIVSIVSLSLTLCVSCFVSNVCSFPRWNPGSWRIELVRQRSLHSDSSGVYPQHVFNERQVQRQYPASFGRHVEVCLQRRVDACNACSQRDPSSSAARKMAGWFDWNSIG